MLLQESDNKIKLNKSELAILNVLMRMDTVNVIPIDIETLAKSTDRSFSMIAKSINALKLAGVLTYVSGYALNPSRINEILDIK